MRIVQHVVLATLGFIVIAMSIAGIIGSLALLVSMVRAPRRGTPPRAVGDRSAALHRRV